MRLGAIVVTYNRCSLLVECIKCIENQTIHLDSIVIVDNNSTDNTAEYLASLKDSRYQIIRLNENLGASEGFAIGIEEMINHNVDYVLIIDDDAHIDSKYIENIMSFLNGHENVEAASGTVIELGEIARVHRRRLRNKLTLSDEYVRSEEYDKEYFYYDLFSFCGIVISRKILSDVGLPRKDYFTQFTDTDYSIRVRKKTNIANVNNAVLNHMIKRGKGVSGVSYKMYYQVRNRIVTILDNASPFVRPFLKISFVIAYNIRIIIRKILILIKNENKDVYLKHIEIFKDALSDALSMNMGKNEKYYPKY